MKTKQELLKKAEDHHHHGTYPPTGSGMQVINPVFMCLLEVLIDIRDLLERRTGLVSAPKYGDVFKSVNGGLLRAYDKTGTWVTYKETDDPRLKHILKSHEESESEE